MTADDLAKPDTKIEPTVKRTSNKRKKKTLKAGTMHEIGEINDECLDRNLHNNNH